MESLGAVLDWAYVPQWRPGAEPTPELEVCMYTREDLTDLLRHVWNAVRVWRPEGSTTMLATCRYPKGVD